MRKIKWFIQRIRGDVYRYRIRLCLYDTAKIRSIIAVTIGVVIACLYVWSVGQACLEETRYIRGHTVVRF